MLQAITNVRIKTITGPDIRRGTVLIEDGRIKAVEENHVIPSKAVKLVLSEKVPAYGLRLLRNWVDALLPPRGFLDSNSSRPLRMVRTPGRPRKDSHRKPALTSLGGMVYFV